MRAGPHPRFLCDHCGRAPHEAELIFVAEIGGIGPRICAVCVEHYHEIILANRRSPVLAAALIEARNRLAANGGGA